MADVTNTNAAAEFLKIAERKPELRELFLPEMGVNVCLREMNAAERDYLDRLISQGKTEDTRAVVIAAAVCHHSGQPYFPAALDPQTGEPTFAAGVLDKIRAFPARVAERIFRCACVLNGIGELDGVDSKGN